MSNDLSDDSSEYTSDSSSSTEHDLPRDERAVVVQYSPNDSGDASTTNENMSNNSIPSGTCGGKRPYTMVSRSPNPRTLSKMRKRWDEEYNRLSDTDLRQMKCCKNGKCFSSCNVTFLRQKIKSALGMETRLRKKLLYDMLGSSGTFYFDGKEVCSTFLLIAFKFSRDLQASIRSKYCLRNVAERSDDLQGEFEVTSNDDHVGSSPSDASDAQFHRSSSSRDAVVSFLERLSESTGDHMPDKDEYHIPFHKKADVYKLFETDYKRLHVDEPSSRSYFTATWKKYCPKIKIRKVRRFAKCSICDELNRALHDSVINNTSTVQLKAKKRSHVESVALERREYRKKRDRAILRPEEHCSIIVDGADQSAFGLPHFVTKTKSERGHSMKVKLVGVLEHRRKNLLHLFTLTEEHETGANHVVEAIHRFLRSRASRTPLPSKFYVQLDNCTRENKNRYLLAYMESLVVWNVFKEVEVSFLPVGHTHEDVDQAFSATSARLRSNDAITLDDLHEELRQTYNREAIVSRMIHVANWSGLCETTKCLRMVKNFSQFRYFRFSLRADQASTTWKLPTICEMRCAVQDEWIYSERNKFNDVVGFLKKLPDLKDTPPTSISEKVEGHKLEVSKRIESEDGRINDVWKVRSLYKLRDYVYRARMEDFHWDLSRSVECNESLVLHADDFQDIIEGSDEAEVKDIISIAGRRRGNGTEEDKSVNIRDSDFTGALIKRSHEYNTNTFVAIRNDTENSTHFWIGKVLKVITATQGHANSLIVHWYEPYTKGDVYTAKYNCSYISGHKRVSGTPWKDTINTDAVIVNFNSLTRNRTIPVNVQKLLKAEETTSNNGVSTNGTKSVRPANENPTGHLTPGGKVYLWYSGERVGTAKLRMSTAEEPFPRTAHHVKLGSVERDGEYLLSVYCIQIDKDHLMNAYTYNCPGLSVPRTLKDASDGGFYVWDAHAMSNFTGE